jgi:uncharacterized protein DUF488
MEGRLDVGSSPILPDARAEERTTAKRKEISSLVQAGSQRDWDVARLSRLVAEGRNRFDFLTAGTSGKTPQSLIRYMTMPVFDSKVIVDIRANPHSQHTPEWNRSSLEKVAREAGIEYVHRPDFGVPTAVRNRLHQAILSYPELFTWYDAKIATPENLNLLKDLLGRHPLFLCTELGPTYCHRHRLALAIEGHSNLLSFDL